MTPLALHDAVSRFGERARAKLANPAATGQPEDQLRAPFETLLQDMAAVAGVADVQAVGEAQLADIRTRPDYAVTTSGALVGFVELKAPGKGADPRRFAKGHDREQWERLRSLPNLLYTDGNTFSLWRDGELQSLVTLEGDIASAGSKLAAVSGFELLFQSFLQWQPAAPRSARELAETAARLCRLLRDEVAEQLARKTESFTGLAKDWRALLFPEANDSTFADGYAQAVTFGLLMARAKGIRLADGMARVAEELARTSSLIGTALRLLTDSQENQAAVGTALNTLVRVLDAVDWSRVSKGQADAWLYFYEDFLAVYDNDLRKQTGSYYTPPEVVAGMVALVDEALRSRFALHGGLASPAVTLLDPATGTGTFILGVLRRIAETVRQDRGEGAVAAEISAALKRLIAFELQLGPFAVAQLRILAEVVSLTDKSPRTPPRMFVTNTLSDPEEEAGYFPQMLAALANQRRDANRVLRHEAITVVLGNPPYKEKARGKGSWVESGSGNQQRPAPLLLWQPPPAWGVGAHSKHLRNLYVYFWRWATWKVFDHGDGSPSPHHGVVAYITVAGFLSGPGFGRMRSYLRETCDDVWVIDCSPEGHQPGVNTRIFQGVQQPVCIVVASRSRHKQAGVPAAVRFRALPRGRREVKFAALNGMALHDGGWTDCPTDDRAPFLPESAGAWSTYPRLEDLFVYNGSGVQAKRTWVYAPDEESLRARWRALIAAPIEDKEALFHPTLRDGVPADRHIRSVVRVGIPGYPGGLRKLVEETDPPLTPVPYAFRSFDRQMIIPDARLITQPNAYLWASRSDRQIYLTALSRTSPSRGPALSFTAPIPDLDHYNGRGGRVFPLWRDAAATESNLKPALLQALARHYGRPVTPEDGMAYVAAVAAHPAYTARFQADLSTPGLRIPVTADAALFARAAALGRRMLWLFTYGERMADAAEDRPPGPPRMPAGRRPTVPREGAISEEPDRMPDLLNYDAGRQRLLVGEGYIDGVSPAMWAYEVSGKQVLTQWFSYRRRNRERPLMGDRRPPSKLGDIQPGGWLPQYTGDLLNLLHVLGLLIDLEPDAAALLEAICAGPLLSEADLRALGALQADAQTAPARSVERPPTLF